MHVAASSQGYTAPLAVPDTREGCLKLWPLLLSILQALACLEPLQEKHVAPFEGAGSFACQ